VASPYSYAQLEAIAKQGGFPDSMLALMAAIAMAESGGNPAATNTNDNGGTQTSWGLWQISNGTHSQPAPNILDPVVNAQQAWGKYNSQGLGAWGTYTSGAYKSYLQGSVPPDVNIGPPAGGGSGGGTGAVTGSPAGLTSDILAPILSPMADITNYVVWVGIAAAGVILMAAGAFLLFKESADANGAVSRYGSTVKRVAIAPLRYAK
jgi:Lysozyme like domain